MIEEYTLKLREYTLKLFQECDDSDFQLIYFLMIKEVYYQKIATSVERFKSYSKIEQGI